MKKLIILFLIFTTNSIFAFPPVRQVCSRYVKKCSQGDCQNYCTSFITVLSTSQIDHKITNSINALESSLSQLIDGKTKISDDENKIHTGKLTEHSSKLVGLEQKVSQLESVITANNNSLIRSVSKIPEQVFTETSFKEELDKAVQKAIEKERIKLRLDFLKLKSQLIKMYAPKK